MERPAAATVVLAAALLAQARQPAPPPGARGVISGRVVDAYGDPAINVRINVETRTADNGTRGIAGGETDDLGEYRIGRLAPGNYLVSVLQLQTFVTTPGPRRPPDRLFYPGATTDVGEAEAIHIDGADERDDIDFVVPAAPAPLAPMIAMRLQQLAAAGTQPPPGGSGIIRGRVLTPDGFPIAHASVLLTSDTDPLQTRAAVSGSDGRFEFRELIAGAVRVAASKANYVPVGLEPGFLPAVSRDVKIAAGETRDNLDLQLARLGAIVGQVVDDAGEPVQGASVQVLELRYEAGRRRLLPAFAAPRLTNDLGRYRLFGLAPGQYIVSATVSGARAADVAGYAPSYYPGTANPAGALFVPLDAAQVRDGIDITMAKARTARIAGRVLSAGGEPTNPGSLALVSSVRSSSAVNISIGARLNDDGTFEFPNVPPGQYVIRADRGRSQPWIEGEFGTLPVILDGADATDLVVQTAAGSSISGRLIFNGRDSSKLPSPGAFELRPLPVDFDLAPQSVATANIHSDWTFEMSGINGPRRLQVTRLPPGWALQEITVRGIDVTDRPLPFGQRDQSLAGVEVRLIDRVSALKGAVVDGDGHRAARATVIVFATDRSRWYPMSRFMGTVLADADGAFTMTGLPFGSYYAVALTRLTISGDDWQDPSFLETLVPRAASASVSETETRTIRLTLRD